MYSLLDIEIHYNGWTQAEAASFLKAFGIEDSAVVSEIYQYILETPGNYLKYYWGYLSLLDLCTSEQNRLGQDFDLKAFHSQVLKIGGVQFPVLEKYIDAEFLKLFFSLQPSKKTVHKNTSSPSKHRRILSAAIGTPLHRCIKLPHQLRSDPSHKPEPQAPGTSYRKQPAALSPCG